MIIKIECNPDIDNSEEVTFDYLKSKLKESMRKFKIEVEGNEKLRYER